MNTKKYFPHELRVMERWIFWRMVDRNGRKTKVPVGEDGHPISLKDERHWKTLDELERMKNDSLHDGVGFVFTAKDGLIGIDLDNAFENPFDAKSVKPWAREILERFREAYITWSPSGKGVHIILLGTWGQGHRRKLGDGGIEVYADKRFFTMTGLLVEGYSTPKLVEAPEALEWLGNRYFGEEEVKKGMKGVGVVSNAPITRAEVPPGLPDSVHELRRALENGKTSEEEILPLLLAALPLAGELGKRAMRLIQGDAEALAEFLNDQSSIEQSLANAFAVVTGGDHGMIIKLLTLFSPRWEKHEKLEREDYLERTAAEAVDWYYTTHRRKIEVKHGVLDHEVRNAALEALQWRYEGRLFLYGDAPVILEGDRLHTLDPVRLSLLLADAAIFQRGAKGRQIDPPDRLVRALLEYVKMRNVWPNLRGIVQAPLVFDNGRVVNKNGYDPDSELLFVNLPPIDIPSSPTKNDAMEAYGRIVSMLDFAFATPSDESAAVAYLLTVLLRPAISLAPLFLITAPKPGSGKTTLAQVGGVVAYGRIPEVHPEPGNEEESRKRIDASLLGGRTLIILDNLHRDIRLPTLEATLTSEMVTIRPLGRSETRTVPNTATFVATGNNIAPRDDMQRRTVVIRIEGRSEPMFSETTEGRKQSFLHEILSRRNELLSALLTIVLAYHRAGKPNVQAISFPSFEEWAQMVRDPLVWLGAADPVETVQRTIEEDEYRAALTAMFEILHEEFGSNQFSSREVANRFNSLVQTNKTNSDGRTDLILELASRLKMTNRFEEFDSTLIGYKLREWRDQVHGGFKLVRVGTGHGKMTKWQLVQVATAEDEVRESLSEKVYE
ncbi:MAG: hypothetical protein IMX03_03770 [Brockia lithotrophica]|nr:hypothetical protein [Brockia lithotrophica]